MKNSDLYPIFSIEFDKWIAIYNPSNSFIDGGRTIPYDFNDFCLTLWSHINHQRGTWFELFREQMLNTAMNWTGNLKDSLWNAMVQFNINSI